VISSPVPFLNGIPSKDDIDEAQASANDADAASRVACIPNDRIGALEQSLLAHAFLYFAAATPATRGAMYAHGLDDVTKLRELAPRRPNEYRWYTVWARVAFAQVQHGPTERSELLKSYSNAVLWAGRAVEACRRKTVRAELQASLLKTYVEGALKFADQYLGRTPPPNPPFRTDLEKKRQEWREILAALKQEK
jgi:hypothetical protein